MGDVVQLVTKHDVRRAAEAYLKSWTRREQNLNEARLEKLASDLLFSKLKVMGLTRTADAKPCHFCELHKWLKKNARTDD